MLWVRLLSMDRSAKLVNRSCPILERIYVLISFSFEKLLSQEATLTHMVRNVLSETSKLGTRSRVPTSLATEGG